MATQTQPLWYQHKLTFTSRPCGHTEERPMYDPTHPVTDETRTTILHLRQTGNCLVCGQPVLKTELTAPAFLNMDK